MRNYTRLRWYKRVQSVDSDVIGKVLIWMMCSPKYDPNFEGTLDLEEPHDRATTSQLVGQELCDIAHRYDLDDHIFHTEHQG